MSNVNPQAGRQLEIVLRAPDVLAALVRSGAAILGELRFDDFLIKRTGLDLESWLPQLSVDQREQLMRRLGILLVILDEAADGPMDATWPEAMTEGRRQSALAALGLPAAFEHELDTRNPLPTRIGASPLVWVDPDARPNQSEGYLDRTAGRRWGRYKSHLVRRMSWRTADVASLERDLNELVKAFPDPALEQRSPRRLLVVGHTQSGKTANFLGLAARMADAGARIVIVLSGRTKILRRQTQARVDRDLIGADPANIGILASEYGEDHRLLTRLSDVGPSWEDDDGWIRQTQVHYGKTVTGGDDDDAYVRPQGGLAERTRPLIAVLKKTPGDLETFRDAIRAASRKFRCLPSLVIDEEADDASLNYKQKALPEGGWALPNEAERSTANRLISEILDLLEAGVYVGYTATPFANCFADADDPKGFFPHAIQVLQAPSGYFGANRVFDSLYDGPKSMFGPKAAHIREVQADHDAEVQLDVALDDYVLAGAVKLFRLERARQLGEDAALQRLRHHTMMVHVSSRRQGQRALVDEISRRLFDRPGRGLAIIAPNRTAERLRTRYVDDFLPRSRDLIGVPGRIPTAELDLTWVPEWEVISPFVIRSVERLLDVHRKGSLVLLVNSDADRETPEYDKDVDGDSEAAVLGRWCILVGGLMLSRGFTVEGLTTVYFRRVAAAMDTQLQLARWNGYRSYFEDLMRIYFGVAEPGNKLRPLRNLYEEFEGSSHRDALFRERLRRYGEEGISPRVELPQFPAEGAASWLPPTAPGKRRGIVELRGGPIELGKRGEGIPDGAPELTAIGVEWGSRTFNEVPICEVCLKAGRSGRIKAAVGEVQSTSVATLLQAMVTAGATPLTPEEEKAVAAAYGVPTWRLAVLGTVKPTPYGTVLLGSLPVPVRLRSITEDPTLSTGEWNRWLRSEVGDRCDGECKASPVPKAPLILILPYVVDDEPTTPKRWGAIIQIHGRGKQLVARPSKR